MNLIKFTNNYSIAKVLLTTLLFVAVMTAYKYVTSNLINKGGNWALLIYLSTW